VYLLIIKQRDGSHKKTKVKGLSGTMVKLQKMLSFALFQLLIRTKVYQKCSFDQALSYRSRL